ncbi:Lysine-specific histone demethylase 1B [Clonorchis sinensis]|uniref:Lysine-specific histone demethylase 1B n=1 Tax=Clonorchis sinensis TaxID=79923 RepID=A0A8T1M211_CLOSI|nr:Lysine-specific histone demethylase 1B [Clonorchis sinensis]
MNISGFELVQPVSSAFCRNGYCSAIIPLCFAGISSGCARNRSTFGWRHFSFGEHVCHACFELLSQQNKYQGDDSVWRHRMSAWRRERLRMCSVAGRQSAPTALDFLASQLLPWWLQCTECGRWRQLPPRTPIGAPDSCFHPARFTCKGVVKFCGDPCSWPTDERTTLVLSRHRDFLASIQSHAWLQAVPSHETLSTYGVDLTGLSVDPLPGFPVEGHALKDQSIFKSRDNWIFSPVDIQAWERAAFPEMVRFPTLYLAVRNMLLCLWFANPNRFLTSRIVAEHCFIRGLLRIALSEYWIPRLLEEFTCRGFINFGACELPPIPNEVGPNISIRIVGRPHLTSAVATRQILNSLFARKKCSPSAPTVTDLGNTYQTFRVGFHPIASTFDERKEELNSLSEICLKLSPSSTNPQYPSAQPSQQNSPSELCAAAKSRSQLTVPLSAKTLDGDSNDIHQLILPAHAWTDRVYSHELHPITCLAKQAHLRLRPVDRVLVLSINTDADSGATTLEAVQSSTMVRMEFHVEAVLDMIAQLFDPESAVSLPPIGVKQSVQESWDYFDLQVRERLTDLDNSQVEKQLVEFYLAAVEYDLTEPLTTILLPNSCSFPTARLDQLPAERYTEFFNDSENSAQNGSIFSWSPQWLYCQPGRNGTTASELSGALLTLGGHSTELPGNVLGISSIHEFASSEDNEQPHVASTPLLNDLAATTGAPPAADGPTATKVYDGSAFKSLRLHTDDGDTQAVDWVILTCSIEKLRLVFSDDVHTIQELLDYSKGRAFSTPPSFPLFLPPSLRPLLVENDECEGEDSTTVSKPVCLGVPDAITPARLITITLVYSSAWWRAIISDLRAKVIKLDDDIVKSNAGDGEGSTNVSSELFALLPTDRENRGFCHVFRDMCPSLQCPGVLQTQIFAAAADHWWDKSDILLTATVDRHLKMLTSGMDNSGNEDTVRLVCYHVARLEHRNRTLSATLPRLCVQAENGQQLCLKPGAWEELARHCHILIADLVFCPVDSSRLFLNPWTTDFARSLHLTSSSAMDTLTSAIQSGVGIAEFALRFMTSLDTRSDVLDSVTGDHGTSLLDSSTCAGDFTTETNDANTSHESDSEMQPDDSCSVSARARRLLKRKHLDNTDDIESTLATS